MAGVPWTKFQDFYLRLGFLKVLVAALSPLRRSATNDAIYRKLESPLFRPVHTCPALYRRTAQQIDWYTDQRKAEGRPYLLEAWLVAEGCPSWLFAVTLKTVYKILDWGHDVQLVGRGNQITERGLLLRNLLPKSTEDFFQTDGSEWNPFLLSPIERLFFMFHLSEIDRVTLVLIDLLADLHEGAILESAGAGKLTCKALFKVLEDARPDLSPRYLPAFRVAYDLAKVIAGELAMHELLPRSPEPIGGAKRLPRPIKVLRRATSGFQGASPRRTPNKNADHQTIPRFEQLVDLGFLRKPQADAQRSSTAPERRWRYQPTDKCRLWKAAKYASGCSASNWLWDGFARTVGQSLLRERLKPGPVPLREVIRFFSDGYDAVRRPIGHTPLESVALHAMLSAALEGYVIEMKVFHDVMYEVKKRNLLPDHAFFASGNDLDTMFINLAHGYREKLYEIEPSLTTRSE